MKGEIWMQFWKRFEEIYVLLQDSYMMPCFDIGKHLREIL